jgi:hypothetical protein
MKTKRLTADALGLVVPINIEAMCVGSNTGKIFQPAPYDFTLLPNGNDSSIPFLSDKVATSPIARVNMEVGVHLHWALPDGITKGQCPQDSSGQVQFPNSPDRWLITRVLTDLSNPDRPVNLVKSWVVESNYVSLEEPDANRRSTTVPFKTDDNLGKQYRYLGRVQEYETWREQFLQKQLGSFVAAGDSYVTGLSAVGYGAPEFAASYQSCKSIFGFHDTETDLDLLASKGSAESLLSYHVVGWYHQLSDDPLAQLPLQLDPTTFQAILAKVTDPAEKQMLEADYRVSGGTLSRQRNQSTATLRGRRPLHARQDTRLPVDAATCRESHGARQFAGQPTATHIHFGQFTATAGQDTTRLQRSGSCAVYGKLSTKPGDYDRARHRGGRQRRF